MLDDIVIDSVVEFLSAVNDFAVESSACKVIVASPGMITLKVLEILFYFYIKLISGTCRGFFSGWVHI